MNIQIAQGKTTFKRVQLFGQNTTLSSSLETCRSESSLYPWGTAASVASCVSDSASDTGTITIVGLNASWEEVSETITLTGTTPVVGAQSFTRINSVTSSAAAVGTITISCSSVVLATVLPGDVIAYRGVYSVPAGKIGYLCGYTVGCPKGSDAHVVAFVREFGGVFAEKSLVHVYESTHCHEECVPVVLAPKSDLDFRASTLTNGSDVFINACILIEDV